MHLLRLPRKGGDDGATPPATPPPPPPPPSSSPPFPPAPLDTSDETRSERPQAHILYILERFFEDGCAFCVPLGGTVEMAYAFQRALEAR